MRPSRPRGADAEAVRQRARLHAAWHAIEATAEGQTVIADLMTLAGATVGSHSPGDPYQTAFNEGRRSIAIDVMERLRWTEARLLEYVRRRDAAADAETAAPQPEAEAEDE